MNILRLCDWLYMKLSPIKPKESVAFSQEEIEMILAKEQAGADANYAAAIDKFMETNNKSMPPKVKRFVVYWG